MRRPVRLAFLLCFVLSSVSSAAMTRERWNDDVTGSVDAILTFLETAGEPDEVIELDESFGTDMGTDYDVARLSGWITVPATGDYTLHFASDDDGALFLSQDEEMANAMRVPWS